MTARAPVLATLTTVSTLAMACAAPPPAPAHAVERSRLSMGSMLTLTAWTPSTPADEAQAVSAFDQVFAEFDRLENEMSVWKPASDIVRLNAAAGEHPVPVSPDVRAILRIANTISEASGGKFDVTFGALSDLWKFDHDQDNRIPDTNEVRRRLPLINFRAIALDEPAGTAYLKQKGMRVHLGGIGKGYAVDRGIEILRGRGFRNFMIQAGGDLYVAGMRGDRPWRLGIQDPRGPANHSFATLDLSDATFSTSGDYERFFMKDGRRYHHILDPATGEPARACRSVTLVSDKAVVADALAKGVFILGPEKGMALAERMHVEAVIISATNEVFVTPGLKGKLVMVAAPTDAP
jgi:thiamine biosynthesis lipoprotein